MQMRDGACWAALAVQFTDAQVTAYKETKCRPCHLTIGLFKEDQIIN